MNILETERLILRTWNDNDIPAYWRINQDPLVTKYLLGPLTSEQVTTFINTMNQQYNEKKYTLFAVQEKASGLLAGFVGLNSPTWQSHFTPCIEIAWRLGSQFWGKGYATEAAQAVVQYGFTVLHIPEIVAFTVPANTQSLRVMEKLGMHRDIHGDFAHPKLPSDHPLSHHVLYKISAHTI